MPAFLVTVRERIDYTVRVDAMDAAHAGDCARACVEDGKHPYANIETRTVADQCVTETEEA